MLDQTIERLKVITNLTPNIIVKTILVDKHNQSFDETGVHRNNLKSCSRPRYAGIEYSGRVRKYVKD